MKNLKTIIILTLVIMLLMPTINANAYTLVTENKIDIMVDGVIYPQEKGLGECHFDSNGRIQIPIRWLAGITNSNFEWDPETNRIVITKGDRTVEFTINSYMYKDNGVEKEMDSYAYVRTPEYRTYLPIRFATEPLGYKVDYIRNQGQVKESNKTHIVKLTYIGSEEKGAENDNSSGTTTIKGISVNPNFSQSQELVALQKQGYVKITENSVSANFNPKQSWISPLIYGLNEKYGYYDVTLPYDPQNEEAYLEVLKYALQYSVEAGDVIYDRFQDMNTTLSNRNLSKADRADYVSKNINKFIKVKEGIYYNITADEGGNIGLIVSKTPLW